MKTYLAALCVALIAVFALSACGGGNDANGTKSDNKKEADKPKTPAEERQALVDAMNKAIEASDADAMKKLFHADEQADAENYIGKDMKEDKAEGIKATVKSSKIEETDGKFKAAWEIEKVDKDGKTDPDAPKLSIVEKDGKWYFSFKK